MSLRRLLLCLALVLALAPAVSAQPPAPQDEFVPLSELPPEEQLPAGPLLIAAYGFAWVAIGAYVLSVARRLGAVQRDIERLEAHVKRGNST
jgi:CcmD family protein